MNNEILDYVNIKHICNNFMNYDIRIHGGCIYVYESVYDDTHDFKFYIFLDDENPVISDGLHNYNLI